jgi:uncharacterized protein (DUF362 family)
MSTRTRSPDETDTPSPPIPESRAPAQDARRRFLRGAVWAGAGATAGGLLGCGKQEREPSTRDVRREGSPSGSRGPDASPGPAETGMEALRPELSAPRPVAVRSRVVQVVNPKVYDPRQQVVETTVQEMVDRAVMELTGKRSAQEAWSSLFSPSEKVGLKPNLLGGELCWTNPEVVAAVVAGLKSAGVKEENLYLWDLRSFDISPLYRRFRATKVNVKTTTDWGFGDRAYRIESGPPARLVKPLLKVDAVVNIPLVKDHGLAGVTCALKSILGSIDNPRDQHTNRKGEKTCDPMVAELSALPEVRKKMRLILTDALQIIVEGGPRGSLEHRRTLSSVFAATDPVAMDRVAWTIIDQQRKLSRMVPLMERKLGPDGPKGRPLHVLTAEKLGLGHADPAQIDHQVLRLG